MFLQTLWAVFFLSLTIQFIYLLLIFGRFAYLYKCTKPPSLQQEEGVSIVVAARNEEENLKNLIPVLAAQNYSDYEILIVDDQSTDGTPALLENMSAFYPQLSIVAVKNTPRDVNSKKYALTEGITAAKNDIILLTDADCKPASAHWIKLMSGPLRTYEKTISLGYGAYNLLPGFLNRLIQYETIFTAINYFSFALWRAPIMGIGRNLCYRKSFFIEKKAFHTLWHINGGDDDLFINRYANGDNTAVVIDPDSITVSHPKTTFKEYFAQKKRHFHAGKYYRTKNKLKLGIYTFTHLIFWAAAFLLLFHTKSGEPIIMVVGLVISRAWIQVTVMRAAQRKMEGKRNVNWTMFFDLVYLGYFWVIGTNGYLSKKIKWK